MHQPEGLVVLVGDSITTPTSPLTESSSLPTTSTLQLHKKHQTIKRRRLPKQVSEARALAKIERDDCNHRFKFAFKAGTDLVHRRLNGDTQPSEECRSVNAMYCT